jgi:hypothetical protein
MKILGIILAWAVFIVINYFISRFWKKDKSQSWFEEVEKDAMDRGEL